MVAAERALEAERKDRRFMRARGQLQGIQRRENSSPTSIFVALEAL